MFDYIYTSPAIQPDQMKVYPCEIVPWTKIKEWYETGKYVPYGSDEQVMQNVLNYAMEKCPDYIRRFLGSCATFQTNISAGKCGNIEQEIEGKKSFKGRDIRAREIGEVKNMVLKMQDCSSINIMHQMELNTSSVSKVTIKKRYSDFADFELQVIIIVKMLCFLIRLAIWVLSASCIYTVQWLEC